jgi:hypothetical protein
VGLRKEVLELEINTMELSELLEQAEKANRTKETSVTIAIAQTPVAEIKTAKEGKVKTEELTQEGEVFSCDTTNVKATLTFPPQRLKKGATLDISGVIEGQTTATLHLNGKAAKSLYTMLRQAYE